MALFGKKKAKNKTVRMQLRGFPGDSNTEKCLLMAAEKSIPLDVELLDILEGASDQQDYRAISPFGKYPCVKEGDYVTSGAPAVLAYMDVRGQGGQLNPKKAAFYGEQNYWTQVVNRVADPAATTLMLEKVCGPMSDSGYAADADKIAAARETLESVMNQLDAQLDGKNFVIGEYSYADIYCTAIAHLCTLVGEQDLIDSRSNVKAWYDRVKSRPSYASLSSLDDVKQKQLKSVA